MRINDLQKDVLTPNEAAAVLGLGRNSTYDAIARGDIPSVRIGRRLLIPKAGLQRMLDTNDSEPRNEDR